MSKRLDFKVGDKVKLFGLTWAEGLVFKVEAIYKYSHHLIVINNDDNKSILYNRQPDGWDENTYTRVLNGLYKLELSSDDFKYYKAIKFNSIVYPDE